MKFKYNYERSFGTRLKWKLRKFFGFDFCGALRETCPMNWKFCSLCYTKWVGPPGEESPRMFCKFTGPMEKFLYGNVCWKAEKEMRKESFEQEDG